MSGGAAAFWVIVVLIVLGVILWKYFDHKKLQQMTPEARTLELERRQAQRQESAASYKFGQRNPALICPHCQTKGLVRAKAVDEKKGISGGKATGALLTGGLSVLATGLSRKEHLTQAHCDNCGSTWTF
jgi:predicted negative regulator of RcsB-dependent stress response